VDHVTDDDDRGTDGLMKTLEQEKKKKKGQDTRSKRGAK
jgi:hypothetical protein